MARKLVTKAGINPSPTIFMGPTTIKLKAGEIATVDSGAQEFLGTPSTSGKTCHVSRIAGNRTGYWSLSPLGIFHAGGYSLALQHSLIRGIDAEYEKEYLAMKTPVESDGLSFSKPTRGKVSK